MIRLCILCTNPRTDTLTVNLPSSLTTFNALCVSGWALINSHLLINSPMN